MGKTIFDKIWDNHLVKEITEGPSVLYIDCHFIHEVTSPQAFEGLDKRGIKVLRPSKTFATCDHNVPTQNQHLPIKDPLSAQPVDRLRHNTAKHGITYFPLGDEANGVVHIIGPEQGITGCGMTIVCGDSHTSTHGAFGNIAFGIGTSEVEMVLATQTLLQNRPKQMLIEVKGALKRGVCAKDLILYIISQMGSSGGTGYFIEFCGDTIESLTMEERMTICNMSIEMGARGALIAPDHITFNYLEGRKYSPKGEEWLRAKRSWIALKSDWDASYHVVKSFDASVIEPMVTYGTNPALAIPVNGCIPSNNIEAGIDERTFEQSLRYMGLNRGAPIEGQKIDYIFLGSCTNGRIEDFRGFANIVKGKRKAKDVIAWLVPGSKMVEKQIEDEGIGETLRNAGFELRQPGCSACLGMNEDKVAAGKYCLSTTNRNFEGRQGAGARTILAGPLVAAASAITGVITDPRKIVD